MKRFSTSQTAVLVAGVVMAIALPTAAYFSMATFGQIPDEPHNSDHYLGEAVNVLSVGLLSFLILAITKVGLMALGKAKPPAEDKSPEHPDKSIGTKWAIATGITHFLLFICIAFVCVLLALPGQHLERGALSILHPANLFSLFLVIIVALLGFPLVTLAYFSFIVATPPSTVAALLALLVAAVLNSALWGLSVGWVIRKRNRKNVGSHEST